MGYYIRALNCRACQKHIFLKPQQKKTKNNIFPVFSGSEVCFCLKTAEVSAHGPYWGAPKAKNEKKILRRSTVCWSGRNPVRRHASKPTPAAPQNGVRRHAAAAGACSRPYIIGGGNNRQINGSVIFSFIDN